MLADSGVSTLAPAIDHGRALVALANGETGRARTHLADAIRGWDERRRTWEGTWARLDLAACHLRSRRVGEAMEVLADVRSVADALGSRPMADRADRAAARRPRPRLRRRTLVTADGPRVRRREARRRGADERRDRGRAHDLAQDGLGAHRAHPREARGDPAHRDRGLGQPHRRGGRTAPAPRRTRAIARSDWRSLRPGTRSARPGR